jgi:hypothetical protein
MGLRDIIVNGYAIANAQTKDLQALVLLEAWIGQGATGQPIYAAPVAYPALVQWTTKGSRNDQGELVMSLATVDVLGPIAGTFAAGRKNPVDPRDRLTLPGGEWAPITADNGLTDPQTGELYGHTIVVG